LRRLTTHNKANIIHATLVQSPLRFAYATTR
jgi:hypothetical protein